MTLKLYSYWRSSASWRVRLALELKQLDYEIVPVHLVQGGGEQFSAEYRQLSPEALVPTLAHTQGHISQSWAICEYLEGRWPEPALLPQDLQLAAEIRSFCAVIACETHPLNNLRVLKYLSQDLELSDDQKNAWYQHWIALSFEALEKRLSQRRERFCYTEEPGLAECFLIPQLYNARRFNCPLDAYPRLLDIDARCAELPAFQAAHPDQQIDKPKDL